MGKELGPIRSAEKHRGVRRCKSEVEESAVATSVPKKKKGTKCVHLARTISKTGASPSEVSAFRWAEGEIFRYLQGGL